jgi:hypothetical protein
MLQDIRSWEIIDLPNPSSRTMALVFTHPLSKMSARRYFWGKTRPESKADNLTAILELIV